MRDKYMVWWWDDNGNSHNKTFSSWEKQQALEEYNELLSSGVARVVLSEILSDSDQ